MKPEISTLVRHVPTGIVGVVEKLFAAGEHPTATCEVVRLSTEELGSLAVVSFWNFLLGGIRNVMKAAAAEADRRGVDPSLLQPLFRAAVADAFRTRPKKN